MRTALDTNVLVPYLNRNDARHPAVLSHLKSLARASNEPCLCPQNFYEFWVVATRPLTANGLGLPPTEARTRINMTLESFDVLADPESLLELWLDLCTKHQIKGKKVHDARLVAWMVSHGIKQLLSFNIADFAAFDEIEVVIPQSA